MVASVNSRIGVIQDPATGFEIQSLKHIRATWKKGKANGKT